ncbi:MAG: hypothetical protein KGM44_08890 [bacterium]|nr:hypothetical protein [bacterium]
MRAALLAVAGAGASFAAAVLLGTFAGWLVGGRTGHPALVVLGLFLGMAAGAVLVGRMVSRAKF